MSPRDRLQLEVPAEPASVREARHAVAAFAGRHGADASAVALCVSEVVTNAVLHAYRDRRRTGAVRVIAEVDDEGLKVVVEDDGVGLRPRSDSPGMGLGLPTVASLADRIDVGNSPTGARISMRFAV